MARHQGDLPAARALAEQAVPLWRGGGDRRSLAVALQRLALVAREQGAYPEAQLNPVAQPAAWAAGRAMTLEQAIADALKQG